jgi:peroxiredoxin Q/BCP
MPDIGDKAPDFTSASDGGGTISLKDHRGKPVVLYFYPKDSTPGCTQEACDFRDAMPSLTKKGAAVIGVSKDSVKRHDNFKAKNSLNFPLVSDESGEICEAYGVWIKKKLYGREYMGIDRATFLIDGKGVIRNVWHKVKVKGHVAEVAAAIDDL